LPIVWVNWHPVPLYIYDEAKHGLRPTKEELPLQAHAAVTAQPLMLGGAKFHELLAPPKDALEPGARYVVKDGPTFRVDALPAVPPNVGADDLWIDIAIASQTLVLYKGTLPIFATLVSTGVDGAGDPEKTKSTPRGLFRIRSKHITARMAAEEKPPAKEGDKPDPRYRVDDVPYVQYFHAGYALHGAYWHDNFGTPRSHGCVNLSPHDAMYLFQKTTPGVPASWHGVFGGVAGGEQGTWIHIRVY
jgi:L,D-transpeptidase catalytic domain